MFFIQKPREREERTRRRKKKEISIALNVCCECLKRSEKIVSKDHKYVVCVVWSWPEGGVCVCVTVCVLARGVQPNIISSLV